MRGKVKFCFCSIFLVPVGGFRIPGPGKSSPPCDSLHVGSRELDFGDFYLIFGRKCKISFFFFLLSTLEIRQKGPLSILKK